MQLSQHLESEMSEIHQGYSGALESKQMVNMLQEKNVYPRPLQGLHKVISPLLIEAWPDLPEPVAQALDAFSDDLKVTAPEALIAALSMSAKIKGVDLVSMKDATKVLLSKTLGERVSQPYFDAWLSNVMSGRIEVDSLVSQRFCKTEPEYSGSQYRGIHGDPELGLFQTKLSQWSFSNEEIAREYAESPNHQHDEVHTSRLIEAEILMYSPFYIEEDPFVDLSKIRELFDSEQAWVDFAIKQSEHLANTDNFHEQMKAFGIDDNMTSAEMLEQLISQEGAGVLNEFYVDAYTVFDDPAIIETLKSLGYDSVAHQGNGISAMEMEYKVFYPHLVKVNSIVEITLDGDVPWVNPEAESASIRYTR